MLEHKLQTYHKNASKALPGYEPLSKVTNELAKRDKEINRLEQEN